MPFNIQHIYCFVLLRSPNYIIRLTDHICSRLSKLFKHDQLLFIRPLSIAITYKVEDQIEQFGRSNHIISFRARSSPQQMQCLNGRDRAFATEVDPIALRCDKNGWRQQSSLVQLL